MRKRLRIAVLILVANWGTAQAFSGYEHSEIGDAAFAYAIGGLDKAAPGTAAKLFAAPHLSNANPPAGRKAEPICAVAGGKDLVCFSFGERPIVVGCSL